MNASDYAHIAEYSRAPRYRDNLQSKPHTRSMSLRNRSHKHRLAYVDKTASSAIRRVVHSSTSNGY